MLLAKFVPRIMAVILLLPASAHAQSSTAAPKIYQVMPLGAKLGSTFELTVTGSDIDTAEGLHFSFAGAKVEVLPASAEPESPEAKKKGGGKKPKTGPQTARKFKVTVPEKVPLGIHDVRTITKGGVSNPRAFVVSDTPEIIELEPNDNVDKAQKINLNTAISGVVSAATDVDYFQFAGKKGARVILSCLTTSVDSRLPAQIEVYSPTDKFLGSNHGYQNNDALLDVSLPEEGNYLVRLSSFAYQVGGPEHFYRLSVSTAPWIDAVLPRSLQVGKETQVTIYGRNLPGGTIDAAVQLEGKAVEKTSLALKPPGEPLDLQRLRHQGFIFPAASELDGFGFRVANQSGQSNGYLMTLTRDPVVVQNKKNHTIASAEAIQVPGSVCGCLSSKGERAYYVFTAKKDQVLYFDLLSDRLGAPTDLYYEIFQLKKPAPDGKAEAVAVITKQDDTPDNFGNQFPTSTTDPPSYRFVAPADGSYYVLVSSVEAQSQFGLRHLYTLRISGDEPDFRLVAMPISTFSPDAVTVHQESHQAYVLFVWRQRGFAGEIALMAEHLPPGVSMKPQIIAGNQKQAAFVVTASAGAPPAVEAIKVIGTAMIKGQKIVREVRAASITWPVVPQQNVPAIARLDRELVLSVRAQPPYRVTVDKDQFAVIQGDKLTLPIKVAFGDLKTNVIFTPAALPPGVVMQPVTVPAGDPVQRQLQVIFRTIGLAYKPKEVATAAPVTLEIKATVPPGHYTLVLEGHTQTLKPNQPVPPGSPPDLIEAAPPMALTVVPKQLARLNLPGNIKVQAGKETEVALQLSRQFDYSGSFQIQVTLPAEAAGLSVPPATIKEGQNEVKLVLHASAAAKAGSFALLVRATGIYESVPVVHEGKLTVAVAK